MTVPSRFLEITVEVEKMIVLLFDAYLKANGFSGHDLVSKLISMIQTVQVPPPPINPPGSS